MSPSERAAVDQAHRQFGEPTATPKPSIYQLTHAEVKTLAQGGTVSIPAGSLIAMPSPNHPSALVADPATPKPRAGEHTPGPWEIHGATHICSRSAGANIASCSAPYTIKHAGYTPAEIGSLEETSANARRIVACVNACEGISTLDLETVGIGMHGLNIALAERDRARAARDMQEEFKNQALSDKKILSAWCYDLRVALGLLLPLAASYLKNAPSSPDNAKLETARAALAKTHHSEAK